MKIYCKGAYANPPAGLYFAGPGWVELDQAKAEFCLRDAPENFALEGPSVPAPEPEAAALEAPPADKQVKAPAKKKAAG